MAWDKVVTPVLVPAEAVMSIIRENDSYREEITDPHLDSLQCLNDSAQYTHMGIIDRSQNNVLA